MAVETIAMPAGLLAELKQFIRVEHDADDAGLMAFLRSAVDMCEAFTAQMLVARTVTEKVTLSTDWEKLAKAPVQAISAVYGVAQDNSLSLLPTDAYAIDIDSAGRGWVKATGAAAKGRVRVDYSAGLASEWNDVPEALRQGIVRLAAHFFTHRDAQSDDHPPLAVTALWRPWRMMKL